MLLIGPFPHSSLSRFAEPVLFPFSSSPSRATSPPSLTCRIAMASPPRSCCCCPDHAPSHTVHPQHVSQRKPVRPIAGILLLRAPLRASIPLRVKSRIFMTVKVPKWCHTLPAPGLHVLSLSFSLSLCSSHSGLLCPQDLCTCWHLCLAYIPSHTCVTHSLPLPLPCWSLPILPFAPLLKPLAFFKSPDH